MAELSAIAGLGPTPLGETQRYAARIDRLLGALAELAPESAAAPQEVRVVRAPGRINLIGEHTDYNLGFVLPAAISLETWIASWPSRDRRVRARSLDRPQASEFELDDPGRPRGEWTDYLAGVALTMSRAGLPMRAVSAVVDSTIPIGSGLSSSAALELAAAWTLSASLPPAAPAMALARLAQRAENEYVGVRCGLMDQFASACGSAGAALLLDCRSLEHRPVALPEDVRLVALDSRSRRRLAASEYNARRAECERAVALLASRFDGVASLRDVSSAMLDQSADLFDELTMRRCRHVVEENERVLDTVTALEADDLDSVGRLFAASHRSLRELYEVSSPELDALVDIATAVPGVIGARMTGAGFGGCTINLVRGHAVEPLREAVAAQYPARSRREAGFHIVDAVDGAGAVQR